MNKNAKKLQSAGLFAGLVSLMCLPCLLAPLLIGAGLSSILVFLGNWVTPIVLAIVGVSLVGFVLSFKEHKNPLALVLALLSGGILYYSRYVVYNRRFGYVGSAFLIAAVITDYAIRKRYKASCEECKVRPGRANEKKVMWRK